MNLLKFCLLVILGSILSGIAIAEISYVALLLIKYIAYGHLLFDVSEVMKGLRVGTVGGSIFGGGVILFRLFKVKGF